MTFLKPLTKEAKRIMKEKGEPPIRKLRIDKYTPKEMEIVYRKINEVIERLK